MPIQNDILKRIYRDMYISGLTNDSEEEWNKRFFANGEEGYKNRKGVYDTLKKNGAIVGDSYEEFAGNIGLRANPKKKSSSPSHVSSSPATSSAPTAPSAPKVQDKSSLTTAAKPAPATTEASRKAEQIMGQLSSIWKTAQTSYNPEETRAHTDGNTSRDTMIETPPTSVIDSSTTPQNQSVELMMEDEARRIMEEKRKRFEAKEKDYREKKPILEKEHDEALQEREKELKSAWEATQGPIFGPGGTYYNVHAAEMMTKNSNDRVHQSRKALQTLEEAHIERNQKGTEGFVDAMGRRLKHFGQDIQEGDMSLFDFGVSEANSYANVLRIVRKVNNGEELTPEEMKVMHVRALQQAVEDGHGDDIGYGYKAMGVTIESLPFMLEMAINPLSGFGKGMAKTAAGRLVKKGVSRAVNRTLGGYVGKKASVTAGRIATRVVGDAIGAAGMAATSGAARVAGDAERRMSGDVTYENADNGDVVYTGNVNQASAGTALFKAFGSVAIENHSEMLGDYFAPILGAVSRKAGNILDKVEVTGVGKKIHLKDARKFINDVKSSDVAKLIDDFQEQTHWDGVIGEYAEEVVGGIENALLVGDEKLTTDEGGVFNLERNIETFLGVGLMGGFMSAVKTAGYRTPHYRQMQDLKRQARDIENSVQNKEAWHEIRAGIDNENDEDTKAAITAAHTDPSFSEDERRAILDYAKKSYQLRGSVAATASETEEKAAAGIADAQDDYNEGRAAANAASPIDLYNAQREYDTAYEMMAVQLGDRMAEQVRGMEEEDLTSYVGEATKENGWSEEDIFALNQYASAKARLDGINDSVSERVQEIVDNAKAEMDKRTGDDGNVTSATLKVGDRKVYVTGGNLVTFDDGSINAQESSQEITVYDPTTGKTEMISPRDILSIDESVNADTEIATAAASAEEEISAPVRQGMEGSIDITTGTTIPSMNGVITVGEEVLDDNGAPTGTYNVDVDGEAAVMSEDEMRSAYDELKARVDEERAVAAERGRSEREAARNEEEYRQQVRVGDDVTFVRDGKRISGRAVMDYDEDSLIVDVEEGARTRSYNVRREEIVAPGTAVEEEETPAVDDNAVQEDDVQTDTWNAHAQEQEETETPSTPEKTGAEETAAPAHADNGTTTSAPSTDEVAVGQETAAPAQTPAAQVQAEQQQQTPANGTATDANENVVTPASDTATMQRESGNATENGTATAANTPASAQDIVSDKNTPMPINEDTGEPDYARATPERTREFLYNESGLEADEADAYVENNAEQAREELDKAKNSKPKMEKGKTLTQFLSEKAAWQQQMDEAQRNVDYWEGVKNAGQETVQGMAPAQDATQVAEPVAGGTEMQNVGQDTVAPSAPVAGNAVTGEAVQDAAMEKRDSLRKNSPVTGEQVEALAAAEAETNTEPTEAQKEAGNYKKGHVKIDGYDITIENPKGSVRSGTDADGKQWSVTMNNTYGYIRGTEGVDGDHIDIFLSDDPSTGNVFVIDQVNADGTFDEHKVMYGFASAEEARDNYLANYSEGWTGLGTISEVTKDEFKKWIGSSHRKTKPFADYKNVKVEGAQNEVAEVVEDKAKKRSMMERIAEKLGYRIEWHETMEQNGLFDPKTKTIHIALDAENPLAAVFGHESMHKIAENAEDYKSILALAKEVLGEKEFERRVDDAEKRYRDAGYDKPRSYYEEEAVCDFMGEMLDNDRLLERVCWDANHRVLAAIRNVIDRILAAIGMADARLMHVRLTVSAAYNNAIRRTETEGEVPTKEGELRASLLRKHDVDRMSTEYHSGKKTGITKKVFDAAQKAMDAMYDMMMPYYEATALGKRMLPEERYGRKGAASTIFSNGSYGKTMENTLKCIRTLAYNEFTDDVKRALGRPLTQKESFLASQMVYDISSDPQCLYCYVSLDRKAYDEFLLRYMQQRDGVLGKFREMDASKRAIGKTAPHTALPELYAEFLDKRKDTKQQQERFDMWIRNEIDGAETITAADLSTADVRSAVLEGLDASMARQVKDAEKYAQSASWAKKDVDYISYVGELLKLSPAWIKKLTGEYGLRFYSFSEYTPAFLLENMQMVRDAALRGLRGLGYTKELDFVKVFAPTGMNINCSCYGRMDSDGNMQMDTRQGADWEEVKRLRGQYRNVGAVFVATNDAAVEWALAQDWIDVVIPFHIVRTGQDIADFYGWSNYSKEQADSVVGSSKKMYISPVEHKNDKAAFLAACEKHGVTPRFAKWLDNPNYMKLVNETRLSVDESSDLQPVFDMDAAADSWKRFVNTGGYYNGWWNVDAEGYADAVRTVVEDIRSGKMANEVDYGRQDVPANVEKMVAAARKKRIHGNVPLVDVYDRSGNALSSGEQRASLRKQKAGSSASDATEAERAMRDALNDVLTSAGIDVVTDVEEGQRVLDEVNGDEVREQKGYYDPRSSISPVRGKWTKEKIVRRLKDLRGAITGYKAAASRIAEFDSAEELADHMFYHGTQFGGGSLKPSILMSDRDIERIGGGGYGDKYWGVSVSRRKDIASRFSSGRSVRIYPIILVKNAKVKEMPNLDDAADLEDYIVDLWKEGVDAVWIGDKNKGEQELCVLNPRAIVNIDTADTYDYFQLGTEENPLHVIDNDGIKKLYDDAVRYVNARRNTPKKPLSPSRYYRGEDGVEERKSDDVYEREFAEYKRRLDEYNNSEEAQSLKNEEEYARRNIRFFRTAEGNAYGFTVNGKVYIDPRMVNAETPIHEYTHLWSTALRERNPKEWKNVVELMKGTDVWDEVVRTYPELKTDDDIADEVLAQYSGRRGAERLRMEMDDVLKSNSGITDKAAAVRAINNVRSALNSFWRSVARMLGLRYTSAEDVADCVLRDMLNLEKPGEMKPNWKMPQRESLDYKSSDDELGYSLWAIKSGINPAKKYLMDFFLFPTEKYRTVFPTPTTEDYFLSTRTDFKTVPTDDVKGTWEEMKNSGKYEYTKSPLSNSEYLVDHETGNIYRMSDHWGPASSCYWTLDGFPGQRYTAETIAKSNIKDFDVWHNKNEKTVPRAFHMREYAREVEQSITNYRDVLAKVPMTDSHRARFERGLAMLEDVQRRLEEGGYKPKKEDLKYQKDEDTIEDYDLYRTVEDEDTIAFLEGQPSVTTYRSMALIDGKLYPPMSSKESGSKQLRNPSELGKWEEAEEAPDKAYKKGNGWYFDLKKDNGKTVSGVAYNPYIHTSTTMLNDQFSEAQDRDNLVVVEMHVPESELTSGYQAEKAKDSVGVKEWKAGIIQGMLSGTREVILTRWAKPVRIVPVEEVAENIAKMIEGKVEVMPSNVVTPQQRKALEERGVEFVETDNKGKIKDGEDAGKTWSSVYGKKSKSARKKNDSPSRIKSAVEALCKKLNLDNVEILDDASGLEGKRNKAKGFYNRKTGKITIVLSNATSVSDAVHTVLHEAVAHYGLRKMFGAHFDTFLDNVFRNADENVRKKIAELSRKHGFNIRTATEEYLASLAEDTNFEKENAGWWNKVKALFADMLRNLGFENFGGITLSDNELRYILWRSYRNLAESGNGVFSAAEDMAKQSALNVGEFSTEDTADADLYRVGDDAVTAYHNQVNRSFRSRFREAWVDGMMSVKAALDAIRSERNEVIEDFENPYLFENQMHGIIRVQSEVFQRRKFEPMVRKFNEILDTYGMSEEDLHKYLMAKHGLERNNVFAMREAERLFDEEKKKNPNTTKSVMDFFSRKDYSGLTSLMGENQVTDAEIEAEIYVNSIEGQCGNDIDELWDLINDCTEWTLHHSYECGELSKEQYDNIRGMFKNYIPLRGWDGTNAQDVYDYIGSKSGVFSGMVKAKGRRSVADNPIAYIGNMAISQIISGNRNRLKQHAYRMAQNHPTSLFTVGEQWYENFGDEKNPKWMVVYPDIKESDTPDVVSQKFDDFYQRMKSLEAQHKAKRKRGHEQIEYPATNSQKHQHIVRCKMNGKEYVLYVNGNPRFAQAINGELTRQSAQESTETAKFFAGVSRWMANNFTSRNPSFIISNAARDMQMAMEMMGIKEGAAYQALLGKNMAKLLFPNLKKKGFAMMPDLMRKFEEGTLAARGVERYFKEFMERGGETGFTSLKDVEQMKLDIISLTRHDQQGRLNPSRALRALGDTFEYYNRCVEDMSRFAVYMTSRQRGKSIAQSIDDAKNCTLNFNRKGSGAMGNATFRHLYIFVNPAIQALSMMFDMAKKHPFRLTATLAGNLIAGAVIPVVNTMCMAALGGDDDDYWNLPVWERRNNIVIWVPGTKRFVTIPLPQEMRCFYGLGEAAVSCMMGHGGEHPAMEVTEQFLDLLPISFTGAGGNMLVNLSPTMLQPLMQIYANTDFTGKPIFRDNEGSKYEPLFQKAYSGTPSWMVKTSKVINDLTGGDTHEQGWYEKTLFGKWANNPAIVNHLLKGYYGGVYSFISGTAGMLTTALGGEMPKTYEIPIVNRFIKDPTERKSAMLPEWYWDIVDERDRYRSEIRRWKDDAKKGDEHAYEKLVEKHQGIEYERYMMRDSYIKQIDEVRKYIKATDDEEEVKMAEEYVRGLSGQLRKLNNLDDEELEKVSRLPSSEFQSLMDMTPKEISKYLKKMPSANEEQQ